MVIRTLTIVGALIAAILALADPATANRETARQVYRHAIPNIEGKSLVAVRVEYAPGAKSPSHRHAKSAFVYAYVLSGAVRSQVGDEPVRVYRAGEGWSEAPGVLHKVSENASTTQPARLLVVFLLDTHDRPLVIPEPQATGH
jgi:quercetin dioxygenase-like cupin family protein